MNTKPITYKRRNLNVSDADYAWLRALGDGNASKGIRIARKYTMMPPEWNIEEHMKWASQ